LGFIKHKNMDNEELQDGKKKLLSDDLLAEDLDDEVALDDLPV